MQLAAPECQRWRGALCSSSSSSSSSAVPYRLGNFRSRCQNWASVLRKSSRFGVRNDTKARRRWDDPSEDDTLRGDGGGGGGRMLQSSNCAGLSLRRTCQRSIFLSLFLRHSYQCFRHSPLAWMPNWHPPGGRDKQLQLAGPRARPSNANLDVLTHSPMKSLDFPMS